MDEEKIKKLVAAVKEQLQSDEDDLSTAVDIAIDFSKQNSIAPETLLDLSSLYGSNDAYAPAYVFANAAADLSEGDMKADACHNAGLALYHMGHNEEAEIQYVMALSLDSKHVNAHSNYGLLLDKMERKEEAEKHYKKALSIDYNDAITHSNYGTLLGKLERKEEAEEHYKIALSIDPNHVDIHSNYGLFLDKMERKEEAEEHYKIVLSLDSNHVITHSNYGLLLKETGRKEEAEEHYKKALSLDSDHASAHYNYGLLLKENGRKEEAEEHYKMSLSLDSNHADIHSDYGLLLSETGRKKEAEEQYKIALFLDSNDVNTHSNYGLLLSETKRYEKAEEHYKKAIALDSTAADIHHNYGLLLSQTRRNDEAEKRYKMALNLNPNHANAHGAYGLLLFTMGKEKKALAEIKTASQLFGETGNNVIRHLLLAWMYERYAERYYIRGNARKDKTNKSGGHFRKSGVYAGLAGDVYIKAGKHADDKIKGLFLSKGYTLKGRSEIRKLEFSFRDKIELRRKNLRRNDYDIAKFELIMNGVKNAANYYEKSAKHSPIRDIQCDACSKCMSVLSSVLGYMLATIRYKKTPKLSVKMKEWDEALSVADMTFKVQEKSGNGKNFVESLRKFISCIDNLEKYKNSTMPDDKRALEDCMDELKEVASNIEGPLQEIIDDSAKRMDKCKIRHKLYTSGIETEPKMGGIISKIVGKVLDKIYEIIAIIIVSLLLYWFDII